jgi:DNA-3-methyladenine glycosylase I
MKVLPDFIAASVAQAADHRQRPVLMWTPAPRHSILAARETRSMATRCTWCGDDPLYVDYHDKEWGVPVRDDETLFEFLILEGAQAGLSWITVLRKREGYRKAFSGFDATKIARYSDNKLDKLLQNPAIIRNRLKVYGARQNARAFLEVQHAFGSFSDYIWDFVDGQPIQNHWKSMRQVPATNPVSDRLSKDMKKRGFTFVGSTIMYAHMQATGMVNDHTADCFRHRDCSHMA